MGRLFLEFVEDDERYTCASCSCDIAGGSSVIWQGMMGQCQPALLFRRGSAVNVEAAGHKRDETLTSGRYTLQDIRCRACRASLGWQYVAVHGSAEQLYKQGTYLLSEAALQLLQEGGGGSGAAGDSSSSGSEFEFVTAASGGGPAAAQSPPRQIGRFTVAVERREAAA